jgi:hypothetical protein
MMNVTSRWCRRALPANIYRYSIKCKWYHKKQTRLIGRSLTMSCLWSWVWFLRRAAVFSFFYRRWPAADGQGPRGREKGRDRAAGKKRAEAQVGGREGAGEGWRADQKGPKGERGEGLAFSFSINPFKVQIQKVFEPNNNLPCLWRLLFFYKSI